MHDEPGRHAGVDGLRALAMTMVIAQHCGLLPFGWTGVWLFYVISGFVIGRSLEREPHASTWTEGRTQLLHFWRRRAARIVPAYGLYLTFNVVLLVAIGRHEPLASLPWLLSFTHNWWMIFEPGSASAWPPFGHLWTLSVEQQFYLLFPLLALMLGPSLRARVSLALVVLSPLARWGWSQWLAAQGLSEGQQAFGVYAASHVQFDAFLLGTLLAYAEQRGGLKGAAGRLLAEGLTRWALAAGLAYIAVYALVNMQARQDTGIDVWRNLLSGVLLGQGRELWVYSAVALAATALLAQTLIARPGLAWLSAPYWAAVGRASYSGYLFHLLLLWTAGEVMGLRVRELPLVERLAAFAAVWLATAALAWWSHRHVELPAQRWLAGPRALPPPSLQPNQG